MDKHNSQDTIVIEFVGGLYPWRATQNGAIYRASTLREVCDMLCRNFSG